MRIQIANQIYRPRLKKIFRNPQQKRREQLLEIEANHGMRTQGKDMTLEAHKEAIRRTAENWIHCGIEVEEPVTVQKGQSVLTALSLLDGSD